MPQGRHRKPSDSLNLKKIALGATMGLGGAVVVPAVTATHAEAATAAEWDQTAQCESTGNWSINSGNGYHGGLQFTNSTWAAYGGTAYAPSADQATKEQQITVAERVLWKGYKGNKPQGKVAWPSCGVGLSNTPYEGGSSTTPTTQTPTPASTGTTSSAQKAIDWALAEVERGDNYYEWGGEGPRGYDCSGFLQAAWKHAGVNIPRDTYGMNEGLPHVSQSDMRPGDLVLMYFQGATGPAPNHVVMYIGDGKIVEMSGSRGNVVGTLANRGGSITAVVRPAANEAPSPVDDADGDANAPATPPASSSALPKPNHQSPSAVPLQQELKRTGFMPKSVKEHPNYGPLTQEAVAQFHEAHRQFKWNWLDRDVTIGPKGYAFLKSLPDAEAPAAELPGAVPGDSHPSAASAVAPVDASVSTGFKATGSMWSLGFHTGVDFAAPQGAPIKAAMGGLVVVSHFGSSYGNHVVIKHDDGTYTLYAHMASPGVAKGTTVSTGQQIGVVGSTGKASGPHLHFEVRNDPTAFSADVFPENPVDWLRRHGVNL